MAQAVASTSTSATPCTRLQNHATGRASSHAAFCLHARQPYSKPTSSNCHISTRHAASNLQRLWSGRLHYRAKGPPDRTYCCAAAVDASGAFSSSPSAAASDDSWQSRSQLQAETRQLVESAMLAATAALAYFLSATLRLESYLGMTFPLPVVIAAVRWGVAAARTTTVATVLLLAVLGGPIRAVQYLTMHGMTAFALGALWRWRAPIYVAVPVAAAVRAAGLFGAIAISSWLIKENILALILAQSAALLELLAAKTNAMGSPPYALTYIFVGGTVVVNCVSYVFLLYILYGLILNKLELSTTKPPKWLERFLYGR
eukprot:jgi/Chlat1/9053/Chrsp94S08313